MTDTPKSKFETDRALAAAAFDRGIAPADDPKFFRIRLGVFTNNDNVSRPVWLCAEPDGPTFATMEKGEAVVYPLTTARLLIERLLPTFAEAVREPATFAEWVEQSGKAETAKKKKEETKP